MFPRAFGDAEPSGGHEYLRRILFGHPWRGLGLDSLCCVDPDGHLIGFLGVMPRRMRAGDRLITMAVSHHFMVDPSRRRSLAGVALMKSFLGGPQDLSLCETGETVRRIWEAVGGTSSLLFSFQWTRYLRPVFHLAHRLGEHLPRFLVSSLATGVGLLDPVLRKLAGLGVPDPATESAELPVGELLDRIRASAEPYFLRPVYGSDDLAWLFDLLSRKALRGCLRARVVKVGDRTAGHFIYFVTRAGTGEVVQVGAGSEDMPRVIGHLLYDALAQGVPALAGRLDPRYAQELSDRQAIFRRRGSRLMFSTRHADIAGAIRTGGAFLTRFETEWWIPFHENAEP